MKTFALSFCLLAYLGLQAQWTTNGPYGGEIFCNLRIGNDSYIGTAKGIYKSTDGGKSWAPYDTIRKDMTVFKLVYDGNYLYANLTTSLVANGYLSGIYVSSDMGKTWLQKSATVGKEAAYDMVVINGKVCVRNTDGVFITNNQGNTWTKLTVPGVGYYAKIFSSGTTLFNANPGKPTDLWRSTDDGQNWTPADSGMTGGTNHLFKSGNTLYAFNSPLVYTSADDGISWTKMTPNPTVIPPTTYNFSPGNMCFNGKKFFGTTGGNTNVAVACIAPGDTQWAFVKNNLPDGYIRSMFPYDNDVFIGVEDELYGTANDGANWTLIPSGITGVAIRSLASDGNNIYCGNDRRINYSTDQGQSWLTAKFSTTIYGVNGIHKFGSTLFAGTSGDGVFKSTDSGKNWGSKLLSNQYCYHFADDGTNLFVGCDNAVYKSVNAGNSWLGFSTGVPGDAVIIDLITLDSNIYACIGTGMGGKPGLYKSGIGTSNWKIMSTGLSPYTPNCIEKIGNTIYVGVSAGVYMSTDFGANWSPINSGISDLDVYDLTVLGGRLIAATDKGVWLLKNGTASWTEVNFNLPSGKVNALTIGTGYLFAATENHSVWRIPLDFLGIPDEGKTYRAISVFPNPADRQIEIYWPYTESSLVEVTISDGNGRIVYSGSVNHTENFISLSTLEFERGFYTIQLKSGERSCLAKFVVVR